MKTSKFVLSLLTIILTVAMCILDPARLVYAEENDDKSDAICVEETDENLEEPSEYIPSEKAKEAGFRIDNVKVGSYSVEITFTINDMASRISRSTGINFERLSFCYTDTDNPDELGKEEILVDRTKTQTNNGFIVEQFSKTNRVRNTDGSHTYTVRAMGLKKGQRYNYPLIPSTKYYWKIGMVDSASKAGIRDRNYPYIVKPVLSGYYSFTTKEGIESTQVSVGDAPEEVTVGATASEVRFRINNPANEELVKSYVTYTASGGWEGSSTAKLHDDGYYHATIYPGSRTVDMTAGVLVRTGLTAATINEERFETAKSSLTPLKLTSSNAKYKVTADKENDGLRIHASVEVDSVLPIDDYNIWMSTCDAKAKPASEDEADETEYGSYQFKVVPSTDSPTGWKAVSEEVESLYIANTDKASVKLTVNYSGDMYRESGDDTIEDSPIYLVNQTVTCGAVVYVEGIRFNDEAVELTEGTAFTLATSISPTNATDKTLDYLSSEPEVATVSSTGVVSAKKAGTTVITASATDGSGIQSSNSVTVTVVEAEEEPKEEDDPELPDEDKEDENYSEDNIWVTTIDDSGILFTGKAIKPVVRVYDGISLLTEKVDYTLAYKNNTKVYETKDGSFDETIAPVVIVKMKGDYSGEKKVFFQIHPNDIPAVDIKNAEAVWPDGKNVFTYTGVAICPKAGLMLNGESLEEAKDFSISYQNNKKAGKATLIFTGQGRFTGEKKVQFTINALDLGDEHIKVNDGSKTITAAYTVGGAIPALIVTYNDNDDRRQLREGVDYKVSYANNKSVTKTNQAVATLTGIGCCKGKLLVQFKVLQSSFAGGVTVIAEDKVEGKKPNQYTTKIKVTDKTGSALKIGKDYEKTIEYYSCDPATGKKQKQLDKTSFPRAGDLICVEVTGKGNYSDEKAVGYYRILESGNDFAKAKVKIADQAFAGKGKAVEIPNDDKQFAVTLGSQTLHLVTNEAEDGFMIVPGSYVNNTKKGTAKVTIRGTGKYGGTKAASFKIVPKASTVK